MLSKRVAKAFEQFAPLQLAGSWDNVGLLIESPMERPESKTIFLTIDLTSKVLEEALQDPSIGVIVSYHPPLFNSFKRLTMANEKERIALVCAAKGISIFSPHTALDSCIGGINDWLAEGLGTGACSPIKIIDPAPAGQEGCGIGRLHTLTDAVSIDEISKRIKSHLGLKFLRRSAIEKDQQIKTIAICAGSGSSVLANVKADLYLTGEMSHHEVLAANAKGVSVILTEHSNSERGYLKKLGETLKALVDSSIIKISSVDQDPLQIF